mmetsp:Transcript_42168/g.62449  ORF Transcript_42168/g.62449 Transcript_42168/m.62449 type:complete len:342 (-) Transcript_42168:53-1078(-)|eukprot:CAMPEP_0194033248 /NCGR_PEP_ID=MMETSP0009_2-20130614/6009_1 /TAXON_ID=210454 /ORGANISM="Grammatophora oceanica, Strain CCMP 410" /LENGTH=341 /DNA_ID=CAMNT_0038673909 /DNA_START=24 /DNA_END=1049 /DNA_ORIENTATION=-
MVNVPQFQTDEVILGPYLGSGAYNDVYEVHSIDRRLMTEGQLREIPNDFTECVVDAAWDGDVVIKFLHERSRRDEEMFSIGSTDLANEAQLLSHLSSHPNVVRLMGRSVGAFPCDNPEIEGGCFLLLERLTTSLSYTMRQWHERESHLTGSENTKHNKSALLMLCEERLRAVLHLSTAMAYLHANGIIYRDLKADNMGFDKRGTLKLFDLGMAKKLSAASMDDRFILSGHLGDSRYMSPESRTFQPYGFKSDVYSFGVLAHEILGPSFSTHKNLASILSACRRHEPSDRPSMDRVMEAVEQIWMHLRSSIDELTVRPVSLSSQQQQQQRHDRWSPYIPTDV